MLHTRYWSHFLVFVVLTAAGTGALSQEAKDARHAEIAAALKTIEELDRELETATGENRGIDLVQNARTDLLGAVKTFFEVHGGDASDEQLARVGKLAYHYWEFHIQPEHYPFGRVFSSKEFANEGPKFRRIRNRYLIRMKLDLFRSPLFREPEAKLKVIQEAITHVTLEPIEREDIGLAQHALAYALPASEEREQAAELFDAIGNRFVVSKDAVVRDFGKAYVGHAKLLRLPGKRLEIGGQLLNGEKFDWAKYRGKAVVVDILISPASDVIREYRALKAAYPPLRSRGIEVVSILVQRESEHATSAADLEGFDIPWPVVAPAEPGIHPLAELYGIRPDLPAYADDWNYWWRKTPQRIVVDREGIVRRVGSAGDDLMLFDRPRNLVEIVASTGDNSLKSMDSRMLEILTQFYRLEPTQQRELLSEIHRSSPELLENDATPVDPD